MCVCAPRLSEMPDYKPDFPSFPTIPLNTICPNLSAEGLNLLDAFLQYDPQKRITAKEALAHPYFSDVRR